MEFQAFAVLCVALVSPPLSRATEDFGHESSVPERCSDLPLLEVLPGRGWDSLRDQDMATVLQVSYSDCKTTSDGRFLIPNNVEAIPMKTSQLDISSDVLTHWKNYTGVTSKNMDFQLGLDLSHWDIPVRIGPFYSDGFKETKETMVKKHAALVRTYLRYVVYSVRMAPSALLDSALEATLRDALSALEAQNTDRAEVLLEFVVRDYGTHFTTRAEAGAILLKEDYLEEQWLLTRHAYDSQLQAAAEVTFLEAVKLKLERNRFVSRGYQNDYQNHILKKSIKTIGGPRFDTTTTVEEWNSKVEEHLVIVDKAGEMLSRVLTPARFPGIDPKVLSQLHKLLDVIIRDYCTYNIRMGCMNLGAPNFDYTANVEGPCDLHEQRKHSLGGAYVTCYSYSTENGDLCRTLNQRNPLTGNANCPSGYTPVELNEERKATSYTSQSCHDRCSGWWIFKSCKTECYPETARSSARVKSYWCAARNDTTPEIGYHFGGIYSDQMINPVTRQRSCPAHFTAIRLTSSAWMCVGHTSGKSSWEFGGLYGCSSTNPLAGKRQTCAPGYQQFMATIDNHCQINYCAKSTTPATEFTEVAIVRPPFKDVPSRLYQVDPSPATTWTALDAGAIAGLLMVVFVICLVTAIALFIYVKQYHRRHRQAPCKRASRGPASTCKSWGSVVTELRQHKQLLKPSSRDNVI